MPFLVPEIYRIKDGPLKSNASFGNNGAFVIKSSSPMGEVTLNVIASDVFGWEHVSVSLPNRCPTWEEMDFIKGIFWDSEDAVMQLHVPRKDWINCHNFCLHLWKPLTEKIPLPPSIMVGI